MSYNSNKSQEQSSLSKRREKCSTEWTQKTKPSVSRELYDSLRKELVEQKKKTARAVEQMRATLDEIALESARLDSIDEVLNEQRGLGDYVYTCIKNKDKRLYTTEELADMCNWELGTYKRKMTELLSREYYSRHLCEPPTDESRRPVYPRHMLQIMQAHLERKFG